MTAPILLLLHTLYRINESWSHLYVTRDMSNFGIRDMKRNDPLLQPTTFVSSHLSHQLQQQVEDPLAICAGVDLFPSWCRWICHHTPFLISYDVRELYMRFTSFTPPRHLYALETHLHSKQDVTETDHHITHPHTMPHNRPTTSSTTINRIQQLKVRVRRRNVLQATRQLFKQHGHKR